MEDNLSMPELSAILKASRDQIHAERKFNAAIQGIDLDADTEDEDAWEKLKARVASGGKAEDSNDIMGLQGIAAQQAGFGIGFGLEMEEIDADGNVTRRG